MENVPIKELGGKAGTPRNVVISLTFRMNFTEANLQERLSG